jgi:glutathione S-transferase
MLKLYYATGTCALATYITLEEAGADYTAERLSFKDNQQNSPDYLKINPKGRVPALVTDRGVLTETPALLQFIAQTHPQAGLLPPDDVFLLARANEFNSYLCSTVHVAHAHRMRGYRWADDEAAFESMRRKVPQTVGDCFELIEREMLRGPWVLGERFSVCDLYLFTLWQWLEADGVDPQRFPKAGELGRRLLADPVVAKVLAEQNAPA